MYTNGGGYDALHGVLSEVEDKGGRAGSVNQCTASIQCYTV